MKLDRRDFVRFAAGAALATGSGLGVRGISRVNAALEAEEVRVPGGPEKWALGTCSLCEAGCGLRVRCVGKRAVRIQGNPLHPVNRGGLCPKGLAALQELYHPDRLRAPRLNTGSRTAPRWRDISWDEAIATLRRKLWELRQAGQAHSVVLIDRGERGLDSRLLRRFMEAYGSPNYLPMPSGLGSLEAAMYFQQGATRPPVFDFDNTRYLLSFGVNVLEGWGSPAAVMRAFGRWRDPAAGRRTKFVQVEPRLSLTASRADEWVAIRPGTEATLALGMASVLIAEDLYDAAFVRERTFGFDDWRDEQGRAHMGFRTMVTSEYRLDEVSAATGVPAEIILKLAREFANNRPAIALGDHQTSTLPGNPYAAMAVHSLNALVGSIGAPGGVLLEAAAPLGNVGSHPARPPIDESPERPMPGRQLARLPEAIFARRPYAVQAVLLHHADPVFSMPNGEAFRRAFQEIPFVASFTSFLNDSSALSDLLLPAPTGLEEWQARTSGPAIPQAAVSLSAPVVPPRHGTRQAAAVMIEIARSLRGEVAAALPFATFEAYLKDQVQALFTAQTGAVFSTGMEETWNRMLERSGWWAPTFSNAGELWDQMLEKGGWWDPATAYGERDRLFETPSRRYEFYSQKLGDWARRHPQFAPTAGLAAGDDRVALPHQPPLERAGPERPLLLMPVEVLPLAGGAGAHLPYLQQIAGVHLSEHWRSWLEIHPETAHKLGIADGDLVWIESPRGRALVRARHYAGAHPETVHLPLGYGHGQGSEWSRRGVNPLALVEERCETVAGLPCAWDTRVRVYRS
jgi:anaerobic selenocysteine-containing dehydrogenase